jgi:hypothetical protein
VNERSPVGVNAVICLKPHSVAEANIILVSNRLVCCKGFKCTPFGLSSGFTQFPPWEI